MKKLSARSAAGCLVVAIAACGSWQRVGDEPAPDPSAVVPRLFDPVSSYRAMGLLAGGDPLPFVGSVRFFAGANPDSTHALLALSFSNNALRFRRTGDHFEARYRIEISFRRDGHVVGQLAADQTARLASFAETQLGDQRIVFQEVVPLPPGPVVASVSVHDKNQGRSSAAEGPLDVRRYGSGTGLSSLAPVYNSVGRTRVAGPPRIVLNPGSTVPYGPDTLRFYLEAYGVPAGATALIRAFDRSDHIIWQDSVPLVGSESVASAQVAVAATALSVGEILFQAVVRGTRDTAATKALVTFSDQWVITNFTEVLSLLRYFGQDRAIRQMRDAPPEQRAALWNDFWTKTDPTPSTPEHEDMTEYFRRLAEVNRLFREPGTAGWLTDRGEVAITLGPPDEIFDSSSDLQTREGYRLIRWDYVSHRLTLDFVDESGFGRFRLTNRSRAGYLQALSRARRSG